MSHFLWSFSLILKWFWKLGPAVFLILTLHLCRFAWSVHQNITNSLTFYIQHFFFCWYNQAQKTHFCLTWQFSWILFLLMDLGIVTTPFWGRGLGLAAENKHSIAGIFILFFRPIKLMAGNIWTWILQRMQIWAGVRPYFCAIRRTAGSSRTWPLARGL